MQVINIIEIIHISMNIIEIQSIENESSPYYPELTTVGNFVYISSDIFP